MEAQAPPAELVDRVLRAIRRRLDAAGPIEATTPLHELPGFDSLAVVDVLEALEDELGIVLDPARVVPETFESPLTLASALAACRRPGP